MSQKSVIVSLNQEFWESQKVVNLGREHFVTYDPFLQCMMTIPVYADDSYVPV